MGAAEEWQEMITRELADLDIDIFNPRRDDWDSSWEQDASFAPFREQVEWELDHLEKADVAVFWFDPAGKAPITLMELGLVATEQKGIVVWCPKDYWRSGNVEIVCERQGIKLFQDDKRAFIEYLRGLLD